VLTFGPYCPGEAPQGLSAAVSSGLEALGDDADPDDARLVADVAVLPGQCVPAVAQGAAETLARMWSQRDAEDTEPVSLDADAPRRTETVPSPGKSHGGEAVALALSGADHARARGLVLATLAETESGTKVRIAVKRARAVAIVASALEAAERAGLATKRSWELFGAYVDQVKSARTEGALLNAAMAVLAPVKRAARKDATVGTGMRQLTALVTEHLEDGITLNEVAKTLGEHPTAITHRLQRKYGLSYSQYVGRLRVDKAKDILRRTQFSVKEVSRRVGISDPSNLSKLFRRFEGMSPQTYRSRFGRKR
jgi:AraC-like DNA-binding protein